MSDLKYTYEFDDELDLSCFAYTAHSDDSGASDHETDSSGELTYNYTTTPELSPEPEGTIPGSSPEPEALTPANSTATLVPIIPTIELIDPEGNVVIGEVDEDGEWIFQRELRGEEGESFFVPEGDLDRAIRKSWMFYDFVSTFTSPKPIIFPVPGRIVAFIQCLLTLQCSTALPKTFETISSDDIFLLFECLMAYGLPWYLSVVFSYWNTHCPWKAFVIALRIGHKQLALTALENMGYDPLYADPQCPHWAKYAHGRGKEEGLSEDILGMLAEALRDVPPSYTEAAFQEEVYSERDEYWIKVSAQFGYIWKESP